jgi:hypothetical protein
MVATVVVQEITGASGAKAFTTISNKVRLFTKDLTTNQVTPQITFPIPIPAAGFSYSYWKHICLGITGTFTSITNIRHYSDGAIGWNVGTDGGLFRGAKDGAVDQGVGVDTTNSHSDGYDQADGVGAGLGEGISGDPIEDGTNGHTFYKGEAVPVVDVADDVVGAPPVIETGPLTEAGKSKAIVFQAKVAPDATSGIQTAETMTFKYDIVE